MAAAAAASQSDVPHRQPGQRRPMCAVCTKPLRLCLCGRLRSPPVDNAVGVTVLQHAMEAHHPLNSTRVARLGLRNLAVAQVTDVNHRARFILTTLDAGGGAAAASGPAGGPVSARFGNHDRSDGPEEIELQDGGGLAFPRDGICGAKSDGKHSATCDFDQSGLSACGHLGAEDLSFGGSCEMLDLGDVNGGIFCNLAGEDGFLSCCHNDGGRVRFIKKTNSDGQPAGLERPSSAANQIENSVDEATTGESNHRSEMEVAYNVNGSLSHSVVTNDSDSDEVNGMVNGCNGVGKEIDEVSDAIGQDWTRKSMDKCTIAYTEKELRIGIERGVKPKIRWLSRGPLGEAAVSNGFLVTKIQMKKCKLTGEITVFEEFSITIPPKSALLFPCQRAISIDASGCQVQHLIVLDGTWAKAQRMYHENPWLQLLPHVKLESDRVSLYSEVRHEPKAGCLSTIESIVVAMRKLGEDSKGLDDLLDVFESMIADQRRCKDENVKQKLNS
ncbi:DTW domain containing protein [Zea mays]|uniref:tRNA-uridine aminocarboxypropyltransferase n=1 Tax=Zea mays TaxID=4577 RepID=A0A1D6GMD6_MAIZE|nr:DTW domain containing protein [Zea mays]AQK64445.1 DTW domain containing protein [Zea mays]|eukprot:NP_001151230.2 DTW domain containing protein [Zea mays]